jgi:hypothetical protein
LIISTTETFFKISITSIKKEILLTVIASLLARPRTRGYKATSLRFRLGDRLRVRLRVRLRLPEAVRLRVRERLRVPLRLPVAVRVRLLLPDAAMGLTIALVHRLLAE